MRGKEEMQSSQIIQVGGEREHILKCRHVNLWRMFEGGFSQVSICPR